MIAYVRLRHNLTDAELANRLRKHLSPEDSEQLLARSPLFGASADTLEDAVQQTLLTYQPVENAFVRLVASDESLEIYVVGLDSTRRDAADIARLGLEATKRVARAASTFTSHVSVVEGSLLEDNGRDSGVELQPPHLGRFVLRWVRESVIPAAAVAVVAYLWVVSTPEASIDSQPLWWMPVIALIGVGLATAGGVMIELILRIRAWLWQNPRHSWGWPSG